MRYLYICATLLALEHINNKKGFTILQRPLVTKNSTIYEFEYTVNIDLLHDAACSCYPTGHLDLFHIGVCSCFRTSIEIQGEYAFADGRSIRKYLLFLILVNLSINLIF